MAQLQFDSSTVAPSQAFEPIPNGWYKVQIVESEIVPTKAGTGTILKIQQKVLEGEYVNRIIFCNLNIKNPNPIAQQIAMENLSAICHAVNTINVQDTQELHGKPYEVKVTVRPAQNGYDASNESKGFRALDHAVAVQPAAQPVQVQPTAQPVAAQPAAAVQPAVQPVAQPAAQPAAAPADPNLPPWAQQQQ